MDISETTSLFITIDITPEDLATQPSAQTEPVQYDSKVGIFPINNESNMDRIDGDTFGNATCDKMQPSDSRTGDLYLLVKDFETRLRDVGAAKVLIMTQESINNGNQQRDDDLDGVNGRKKISRKLKTMQSTQRLEDFEIRLRQANGAATAIKMPTDSTFLDEIDRNLRDKASSQTEKEFSTNPGPLLIYLGRKKTIFTNIAKLCELWHRTKEHLTAFIFPELGTSGSLDDEARLVMRGFFKEDLIEKVLKKYREIYIVCKTCNSDDTLLTQEENRTHFLNCNSCGSQSTAPRIRQQVCRLTAGKRREKK